MFIYLFVYFWYWFILSFGRLALPETTRVATDYEPLWLSFFNFSLVIFQKC